MSDLPIISRDHIRTKARNAFERGECLTMCALPLQSCAYATFKEEYERLSTEAKWIRETDRETA